MFIIMALARRAVRGLTRPACERLARSGSRAPRPKVRWEVVLPLAIIACSHGVKASRTSPRVNSTRLDSLTAVNLAVAAMNEGLTADRKTDFIVHEYKRDDGEVTITLLPRLPDGVIGTGGGGRVTVSAAGHARIIELFQ